MLTGKEMDDSLNMPAFLHLAAKLEFQAEKLYQKLSERMQAIDNGDAAAFFAEMAGYCGLHLRSIQSHEGYDTSRSIDTPATAEQLPVSESPVLPEDGRVSDLDHAIAIALEAERRGLQFYEDVGRVSHSQDVRNLAAGFVDEEREHVLTLERFLGVRPY